MTTRDWTILLMKVVRQIRNESLSGLLTRGHKKTSLKSVGFIEGTKVRSTGL